MLQEKTAKLARADSQALRQIFERLVGEPVLINQSQRAGDRGRGSEPGRSTWRSFGAAAQAGPETSLRRGRGRREVADIGFFGRGRRADRPAVNTRRGDGYKEAAVESRVSRAPGTLTG